MSIVAMIFLMSACASGGDLADPKDDPAAELPLRLEDELPPQQQGGLDNAPVERSGQQQQQDFSRRQNDDDLIINLGAHARFTIPFGAADRNYSNYYYGYYYVTNYTSWADLFNPGWGIELEADFFFGKNGPGHRRSPGFNYGLALLFQADQYYGSSTTGATGTRLSLDDMTATSLQIGGRVIQTMGTDVYFGGIVALGAVHYSEVEGTFSGILVPGGSLRDKVFRDTYTFASTFRADAGYRLGALGLTIGMGLRLMAPPSEGSHWSMDSGAFWTFDIDLGIDIGF